jgi:hypothetical protein
LDFRADARGQADRFERHVVLPRIAANGPSRRNPCIPLGLLEMLYYYPYRFNLQWYCYDTSFIDRQDLSDRPRRGGFG